MVFSSPVFLFFFFPVVYLGCRFAPRCARNGWLALSSLVFYAFGQLHYTLLLLASVTANYCFGRLLMRLPRHRRIVVACAAAVNLLVLGAFKYLDFLAGTFNGLFGLSIPLPGIVLPIGISFYTFQGLSYVIDVYRDPQEGAASFPKLLLYISFFPQLIAGPIVRYLDIREELAVRRCTWHDMEDGILRFLTGFSKKVLLANNLAILADKAFSVNGEVNGVNTVLAWGGVF